MFDCQSISNSVFGTTNSYLQVLSKIILLLVMDVPTMWAMLINIFLEGIWNNRFYPTTSIISTANRSAAHDLLAVGDTDGYIRLFR